MHDYEEYHEWSKFKSWLFVCILSAGLIGWAMTMMTLVKDVPRKWDFDTVDFTPGKSVYSTTNPDHTVGEKMVHPLPEAISMEEKNAAKNN